MPVATHSTPDLRNLAFVGHSGAGKTTLVETLLQKAGVVNQPGSIDRKDTLSDFTDEEHHHGHSLFASVLHADYRGKHLNLLDAPGAPDFIGQTVSILPAVETVAVVINAQSGIQPVTRQLMQRAADQNLCRMIVVNKIDAEAQGVDLNALLGDIQKTFGKACLPLNLPAEGGASVLDCFQNAEGDSDLGPVSDFHTAIIEQVVEVDDALMDLYLEQGDVVTPEQLHAPFEQALREGHLVPICFTSATNGAGVNELLDMIVGLAPNPTEGNPRPFVRGRVGEVDLDPDQEIHPIPDAEEHVLAHVFNVRIDPFVGKLAALRVHQGTLTPQTQLFIDDPNTGESKKPIKAGHLFKLQGKEHVECDQAVPGDIVALAKVDELHFDAVLHDSHDEDNLHLRPLDMPEPMAGLAILPKKRGDEQKIADALTKLQEEDPTFRVTRDPVTHETVIHGLGDLHLRILLEKLHNQHHVDVDTQTPKVAYRETIQGSAKGHHRHKKQTGGAGQFGEVHLEVVPTPRGEGFVFEDKTFGGSIPKPLIPAIEKGVRQAMGTGALAGYPLQDLKVSVTDGKYHAVDSKEIAFVTAGKRAFLDAVLKAKPTLLEPMVELEITAPNAHLGDITSDLSGKRGRVVSTDFLSNDQALITAVVPLAEVGLYPSQLKSMTGGLGSYTLKSAGHEPVPSHLREQLARDFKPDLHDD
ncbi:elongation factor G [Algisphaera agarilytica]|uniref:Elongation factor G n=1 Tax=Algisphaera agarilytica TaxID=1385975 RepID=A0A7X0H6J1_9BACT|nr:elongation factor G [Algisphaera agarilytica]MBB6429021.1 elongation factor G [Algisphaera agarilytica]